MYPISVLLDMSDHVTTITSKGSSNSWSYHQLIATMIWGGTMPFQNLEDAA